MNPHDLMEVARALAESGDAPPTQVRLCRAISTAYYAMFHCLAMSAADLFIGTVCSPAWHRTYRALERGRARSACRQAQTMPQFPAESAPSPRRSSHCRRRGYQAVWAGGRGRQAQPRRPG